MNPTSIRRGRVLLLAAVTVLVVLAGSAAARAISDQPVDRHANGPQYVTESVAVAKIAHAAGVAPCPDGTRAIDGGLTSDSQPYTHVVTSTANADGSGWSVELWNQHPSRGLTVHVWAACLAIG